MAMISMRFPEGKSKALTLSYDDGVETDIRLIEIMKAHGLKGTFNINSGCYSPEDKVYEEGEFFRRLSKSKVLETYGNSGMEIAVHGLTHTFLEQLPREICTYEVLQDRLNLEEQFQTIVRGMAYPFGTFSDTVVDCLKAAGIVYSRTVTPSENFCIPTDWLRLNPTCHHRNSKLMDLAKQFTEDNPQNKAPWLFYLWGHSYEFERDNNWYLIENFSEHMVKYSDIWHATNIEIYDYIQDYNRMRWSANGKTVYNPTNRILYFLADGVPHAVGPGEMVFI